MTFQAEMKNREEKETTTRSWLLGKPQIH